MVRRFDSEIEKMDRQFEKLHKQSKIPSIAMRRRYRSKVHNAELAVLKSGFDIVLCTCNEASSHRLTRSLRPVYCIVDECAMCTEPESMVPIQRAEHVVLIGDHQQLRPVIKSRDAEAKGLGTSLFERYAKAVDKDSPPLQKPHMLTIQYRMVRYIYTVNFLFKAPEKILSWRSKRTKFYSMYPSGAITRAALRE